LNVEEKNKEKNESEGEKEHNREKIVRSNGKRKENKKSENQVRSSP